MLFAPTTTCRSLPGTPESNAIGLVYNPSCHRQDPHNRTPVVERLWASQEGPIYKHLDVGDSQFNSRR